MYVHMEQNVGDGNTLLCLCPKDWQRKLYILLNELSIQYFLVSMFVLINGPYSKFKCLCKMLV